ncbi:MAG: type I methionyl aminopeptidase [Firmicutes bacterium]|nr:type I methionyl aminopeptidase [Bacillota bacterium]
MRIIPKSADEIKKIKASSAIVKSVLDHLEEYLCVGISSLDLDKIAHDYIVKRGAKPAFLGYGGFPASLCVSINDEVVHGLPKEGKVVRCGDVVALDVGVYYNGYNSDAGRTYIVGRGNEHKQKLVDTTKNSLYVGLKNIKAGSRVGDISKAIQKTVEAGGYSVVRDLTGHGIGKKLHEEPSIPNFFHPRYNQILPAGATICVEPMVNAGKYHVVLDIDGFTYKSKDGSLSAFYEHCIVILSDGIEILTS